MNTFCYCVTVKTTNATKSTVQAVDGTYLKCVNGELYVTTTDPSLIFKVFGDAVVRIDNLGFGYHMMPEADHA